jgi:hypothetical protein
MDEVVSLLPLQICHGGLIEKERSITWFPTSHDRVESTDLFRDMGFERAEKDWRQNFSLLPRGRGVMAIMVGSFTLQLPTFASVATLLNHAMLHVFSKGLPHFW